MATGWHRYDPLAPLVLRHYFSIVLPSYVKLLVVYPEHKLCGYLCNKQQRIIHTII